MKKVLVTGAGGYIGTHVVNELLKRNVDVVATSLNDMEFDGNVEVKVLDIFDKNIDFTTEFKDVDSVIHLAWKDGFVHNSDAHIEMLNDHYKFLTKLIDCGIKNITVMGTMHEVGYWEGAITEDTPCNPTSLYGISKNALRQLMFTYTKDKDVSLKWVRAYYIYGDDLRSNSIFRKLKEASANGQEKFPFTTGKNQYDFIPVEVLARQIVDTAMQTEVNGVINCCSGKPMSLKDKILEFIEENNLNIELEYGAFPDREYDSPIVYGDSSKIELIMGINEKVE